MKEQPDPKKFADDFDRVIQEIVKPPVQSADAVETSPVVPSAESLAVAEPKPKPVFFADVDAKRKKGHLSQEKTVGSEDKSEVEVLPGSPEAFKKDMEAKRMVYAQLDLDKSRKWAKLKNLLGAGIKEVKDEDYDRAWGEYEEAKSKYFEVKRADVLNNRDKEGAREFLREFEGADEAIKFLNLKYDLKKEQSGYPAKILYGFEKLANGWKEMSWKKKLIISGAIFGLGFAAASTVGFTFGGLGALAFTARTAQRALGAGAMYIGAKRWMDTRAMKKEKKIEDEAIDKYLSEDNWIHQIEKLEYGKISESSQVKRENIEALDRKHKRCALILAGLPMFAGTMYDMYRQGYLGAIKNTTMGFGSAVKEKMVGSSILTASASAEHASVQGIGGGAAATQMNEVTGGNIPESQFQKPLIVPEAEQPPHQEYSSENRATEGGANFEQTEQPSLKPEVQTPEIAKPKFEDIPVKIKAGGNMWASIEHNIKANPSAYGLDQTDPNFKTNMNGKISGMLHDFADKKGLSYKQLDKVFEGDNFKIKHDMAGNPYLDDFHGKGLGGGHVSHGGAAAQEAVPSKANVSVDDTKPKASVAPEGSRPRTGAVAEHQPSRGAVQVPREDLIKPNGPRLDDGSLSQVNQKPPTYYEQLSPEQKHSYDLAHVQQVNATGKLLCRVFEGAGVSKWADVLNQPMKEWSNLFGPEDQISQDVQLNDATDKVNLNLKKLRELYPILKKYQTRGIESIGECLFKAMKDPANALKINMNVLTSKH